MRFAYADPPYIGQAKKLYNCAEINHEELIRQLNTFDAWALSCSSPSLRLILPICPEDVRIMAWVKPFASFKPNINPAYCWEPMICRGGRKRGRKEDTVRDWYAANITLKKGLAGAKPEGFCFWLFDIFNLKPTDEFHDLFYGTGAVTKAWEKYKNRVSLESFATEAEP